MVYTFLLVDVSETIQDRPSGGFSVRNLGTHLSGCSGLVQSMNTDTADSIRIHWFSLPHADYCLPSLMTNHTQYCCETGPPCLGLPTSICLEVDLTATNCRQAEVNKLVLRRDK